MVDWFKLKGGCDEDGRIKVMILIVKVVDMVRQRVCGDIGLAGLWWCYLLRINEVLDFVTEVDALVSKMANGLGGRHNIG